MFTGSTRWHPGLTLTSHRSQGGNSADDKEDDDDRDEVNGDEVNGDILKWRTEMQNGAALTLVGYNC